MGKCPLLNDFHWWRNSFLRDNPRTTMMINERIPPLLLHQSAAGRIAPKHWTRFSPLSSPRSAKIVMNNWKKRKSMFTSATSCASNLHSLSIDTWSLLVTRGADEQWKSQIQFPEKRMISNSRSFPSVVCCSSVIHSSLHPHLDVSSALPPICSSNRDGEESSTLSSRIFLRWSAWRSKGDSHLSCSLSFCRCELFE